MLNVKLRGNQCAIYEVAGKNRNYFMMVNQHKEMLITKRFATPMTYMGSSVEDVESFYLSHNIDELIFSGEFKEVEYQPLSLTVFNR